jgi:hypothetical protein
VTSAKLFLHTLSRSRHKSPGLKSGLLGIIHIYENSAIFDDRRHEVFEYCMLFFGSS